MTRLILRADASHRLGAGHVVRLTAIADAARAAGGHARLVIGGEPGRLIEALVADGYDVVEAGATSALVDHARAIDARGVVLDAPHLPGEVAGELGDAGLRVASFDDAVGIAARAPLVIDPSFGAERGARARDAGVRAALLGRMYAPLRAGFLRWPHGGGRARRGAEGLTVLVSFGGSDPLGATPRAVRALVGTAAARVIVVAGAGFRNRDELEAAIGVARAAGHVVEDRGPVADMAALMVSCDVAICGAGGTLAELAYLGRPAAAYAVAPDQVGIAAAQAEAGLVHGGIDLATAEEDALAESVRGFLGDAGRREAMAERAARTVDGRGAERIVAAM